MRFAWATDVHLDFAKPPEEDAFFGAIAERHVDGLLLTGDIAGAATIEPYLNRIHQRTVLPVWFVLGNHDYYGGSIGAVRRRMRMRSQDRRTVWLGAVDVVPLSQQTGLCGHDGWGDARLGRHFESPVDLADFHAIADLAGAGKDELARRLARLGDESADHFASVLPAALRRFERLIVLTHVPPFREACWHQGKHSDDNWLPYFACKAVGDVLLAEVARRPDREVTVLCGHTHGGGERRPLPNLRVVTGAARYGQPEVQPFVVTA